MPRLTADERDNRLLEEISRNISAYYAYYSSNIENSRNDKEFVYLSQYDSADVAEFNRLGKPMLTYNKIYDYVKKVVGEERRNRPNLQLTTLTGNATNLQLTTLTGNAKQEQMDLREGILKRIAFNSQSDIAYSTAFENMMVGGFGAIKICSDYAGSRSFEQEIYIEACPYPERVFFDPYAKEPTKHDGDFCGGYTVMNKDAFMKEYPDVPYPASFPTLSPNVTQFNWGQKNSITLVEYYKKEYYQVTIHKLSDGTVVTDKEYKKKYESVSSRVGQTYENEAPQDNQGTGLTTDSEASPAYGQSMRPEGAQGDIDGQQELQPQGAPEQQNPMMQMLQPQIPEIIATRKTTDYRIKYYKCISNQIIEKRDYPGHELPYVFAPGDLHIVDGKELSLSFVRFVKDAQRSLNYIASEVIQAIKNNRREQFMATPANIEGFEEIWRNPSLQQGALLYNPDSLTQQPPIHLPPAEVSSSLLTQYQRVELDIQSILGFYEASRGNEGQELSGVAIRERQRTSNMAAKVFFDNLDRTITQVGRVIMSMIPDIYDTERTVKIIDKNGKTKDVVINRELLGGVVENDMTSGEYDVVLEAGPSFAVQREAALEILMQLAQKDQVFPLIADLIADNIEIENSPRLKERLENLVPPQILAKEKGLPPPPPQQDPQMMMQQQAMQLQMKQLELKQQQLMMDTQSKQQEAQLEAAKLQVELDELQTKRQLAGLKAHTEITRAQLDGEAEVQSALAKMMSSKASMHKTTHGTLSELIKSHSPRTQI